MQRIGNVEREYRAIRLATDRLIRAVNDDPAILEGDVKRSHIGAASQRLEGTYIVRVFSEFETALHQFRQAFHIRKPGGTEALVNRVRDRAHVSQADTDAVHRVREYRNVLVHARLEPVPPITIRDSTRYLCTFLSRVQRIW